MQTVFVIARDWRLRAMVRAELLERGIHAVGISSASEAGVRIAAGDVPAVVVLEASAEAEPGLESLAQRVPFVVVSSVFADVWPESAARVLHRPVSIAEIVATVLDLLRGRAV